MGVFDFVSLASFIIALAVGPFIVGSCNPVLWVFYLGLCTMLTPLLGIPIIRQSSDSPLPFICLLLYNILKYYGTDNVYTRLLRHYSSSTDAFPG